MSKTKLHKILKTERLLYSNETRNQIYSSLIEEEFDLFKEICTTEIQGFVMKNFKAATKKAILGIKTKEAAQRFEDFILSGQNFKNSIRVMDIINPINTLKKTKLSEDFRAWSILYKRGRVKSDLVSDSILRKYIEIKKEINSGQIKEENPFDFEDYALFEEIIQMTNDGKTINSILSVFNFSFMEEEKRNREVVKEGFRIYGLLEKINPELYMYISNENINDLNTNLSRIIKAQEELYEKNKHHKSLEKLQRVNQVKSVFLKNMQRAKDKRSLFNKL